MGAVAAAVVVPMAGVSSAQRASVSKHGFEQGTQGWVAAGTGATLGASSAARSGKGAAVLSSAGGGKAVMRDRPNVVRKTAPGKQYRISAWAKASRPGVTVKLRVLEKERGASHRVLDRKTASKRLQDTRWHRLVVRLKAAGRTTLASAVVANGLHLGQSVLVDDVRVRAGNVLSRPQAPRTAYRTQFGTSTEQGPGENWSQAIARRDRDLGRAKILRVFYPGLPQAWPGRAGTVNRNVVVSFKANPVQISAGRYDTQLRHWFAEAPKDRQIFWSYFHEPEDNIERGEFTAAQYRSAWRHLSSLAAAAHNPKLKSTLILMSWSTHPRSHRNWRDYYVGKQFIDVLGWDAYNTAAKGGRYEDPAQIYSRPASIAKAEGKPFGFAEWGSEVLPGDNGTKRAAWIRASAKRIAALGATFATYFDSTVGGDFRLSDHASKQALRAAITAKP